MTDKQVLLVAFAVWLIHAATAVCARCLLHFSPHDMEEICKRHGKAKRLGKILRANEEVALAADVLRLLAATVLVSILAVWLVNKWKQPDSSLSAVATGAALSALVLLVAEVWLPWAICRVWGAWIVYLTWPFWQTTARICYPLVQLARLFDIIAHRIAGRIRELPDNESFEEEIRSMVTEGHHEGLLEEDAREMIEKVIRLDDVVVSQIMTPRTDMICIPIDLSWSEMLKAVIKARHSRIPVYRQTRDDIVGVLYVRDLLPYLAEVAKPPEEPWTNLLREPWFIPETKHVDVLLEEFQDKRSHMAIVLDEYGGVSGIVTMEDVLEEIVGEIRDEAEKETIDELERVDDTTVIALGKAHLDEINRELGTELPENGEVDSIGGFIFTQLGYVPKPGETLTWKNLRLTVLQATRRRVERVKIELLGEEQNEQFAEGNAD